MFLKCLTLDIYNESIYCCSQLFQVCATRSLSHFNATKPADSGIQGTALRFVEANVKEGIIVLIYFTGRSTDT